MPITAIQSVLEKHVPPIFRRFCLAGLLMGVLLLTTADAQTATDTPPPEPSAKALRAASELIGGYVEKFRLQGVKEGDIRIIGHQQASATQCPGRWFQQGGQRRLAELAGLSSFLTPEAPNFQPHPKGPVGKDVPVEWFRVRNGQKVVNWEAEREQRQIPLDTIVIHHYATMRPEEVTAENHSDLERERIYVKTWPHLTSDPDVRDLPVQSGHYRGDVEVFYTYHWLIFPDGKVLRLLHDREVAWHAGNWITNCRSVAICFVGDFS